MKVLCFRSGKETFEVVLLFFTSWFCCLQVFQRLSIMEFVTLISRFGVNQDFFYKVYGLRLFNTICVA